MQICMLITFRIVCSKVLTLGGNLPYCVLLKLQNILLPGIPFVFYLGCLLDVGEPADGFIKLILNSAYQYVKPVDGYIFQTCKFGSSL